MILTNKTCFLGTLVSMEDPLETTVRAAAILKCTYDLLPDGRLTPAQDQLPISGEPLVTPYGILHGDLYPSKQGADFVIFGTVYTKQSVTETYPQIQLGSFRHSLRVVGDRVWQRKATGELVASAPIPFSAMPLTYSRASGRRMDPERGLAPHPDNPSGIGFYETAAEATEMPLPNIESANRPSPQTWSESVAVAGWGPYPMFWGLRARAGVRMDEQTSELLSVERSLFNQAHPELVLERIAPGSEVLLTGVGVEPILFKVPPLLCRARTYQGSQESEVRVEPDGLFVWLDQCKIVVTYRARFRYELCPGETRDTILELCAA